MSATCPSCGAPQPDPPPRFCDACGLAVPRVRRAAAARPAGRGEPITMPCSECGLANTGRRCRGCGARVRWPEDVVPPDEAPAGKPAEEALELPDDGGADVPLDDEPGGG